MENTEQQASSCRICGSKSLESFLAREMMFGLRSEFEYLECSSCGCVQIASIPEDMGKHYPENYYSFSETNSSQKVGLGTAVKNAVRRLAMDNRVIRRWWLGLPSTREWLVARPVVEFYVREFPDPNARLLDVGCGSGSLLHRLMSLGYSQVEGVDPFIAADVMHHGRTLVWKKSLAEMSGEYDCVSFHHSLEHMPDQAEVMRHARRLLAPGGTLLISIPVAGTQAWRTYRQNWVQLDPPRHFYCHTEASLRRLANDAGLVVTSVVYDSSGFQFWGSEMYLKDIPLLDARSPLRNSNAVFTAAELAAFDQRAAALNVAGDGDQLIAALQLR